MEDEGKKDYITKRKGVSVAITTAAGTVNTTYNPTKADGRIKGISTAANYADVDFAQILLSITQGKTLNFVRVPLSQLLPTSNREYTKIDYDWNDQIFFTVESLTANSLSMNQPTLILHFHEEDIC